MYKPFEGLAAMEFEREAETVNHKDENIVNNRLFVWNFERIDLEEYVEIFTQYKDNKITDASRKKLSNDIQRKNLNMLREGYNPVECMLYASKVINIKLQSDRVLQSILAEKVRDIYIKQESETISVFENIIEMWTWVPQLKVIITAIGLIGDNEELLDSIAVNYTEDASFKTTVFYAFLQNKTVSNLERAMKIIMNLENNNAEDEKLGKIFQKQVNGFGFDGIQMVKKYYENPGVSSAGAKVLKKIMIKGGIITDQKESIAKSALAKESVADDMAYKEFIKMCREDMNDNSIFLCRFSRPSAGDFLKNIIGDLTPEKRDTALISLSILGNKGYTPAKAIIEDYVDIEKNSYAVMVALTILKQEDYAKKIVEVMCNKPEYNIHNLYRMLKNASVTTEKGASDLISKNLEYSFIELAENKNFAKLEALTSNLEFFWGEKLFSLISRNLLNYIYVFLNKYVAEQLMIPDSIIISLMGTIVHNWNNKVEDIFFTLFHNAVSDRVKKEALKILKTTGKKAPV